MNKKQEIEKMEIDTGYLNYEFSKQLKDLGYNGMSLMLYIKDAYVGWYSRYITNEIIDKLENTTEESCVAALRPFVFNWFDEKTDWDNIKKVLSDSNLLQKMKTFDVNGMKEKTEIAIKKKIASNPEFTPANV